MTIQFQVTFDDPGGAHSALYAGLRSNAVAAGERWGNHFISNATITIEIGFVDTGSGRASGGSVTYPSIGSHGSRTLVEPGAANEIRTGTDPNGAAPDIRVDIAPGYLSSELWLDPSPGERSVAGPQNRTDAVSVFIHEVGHALGFIGYRDWTTGQLGATHATTFDTHVSHSGSIWRFSGTQVAAVYGGPLPLTSANIYHYGNNAPLPGSVLVPDGLMNGVAFTRGFLYDVAALDIAVMEDLGLPVNDYAGYRGNDVITAGGGNDLLLGLEGNDSLTGGAGNDILNGGAGNDTLNGGAGTDTGSYANAAAAVMVNLALTIAQNTGGSGTDRLISVEGLTGSAFGDALTGSGAANTLAGGNGNDTLNGGAGNDVLSGNAGTDRVSYAGATAGVSVNLALTGQQNTQGAGNDTLSTVENLTGSAFADLITGSGGANSINGGNGNDTINGGGGNDALTGGGGNDTVRGQAGADVLTGSSGADHFDFDAVADTGLAAATRDRIADFNRTNLDKINLLDIDANATLAGNQAFQFIGGAAFSGNAAGKLRFDAANHLVLGSTDADTAAEFSIQVNGLASMQISDFVL